MENDGKRKVVRTTLPRPNHVFFSNDRFGIKKGTQTEATYEVRTMN